MHEQLERLAERLETRLERSDPGLHLDEATEAAILELTAVVAHGSERKNAPLAAFLAARYATLAGTERGAADHLDDVLADAREIFEGA